MAPNTLSDEGSRALESGESLAIGCNSTPIGDLSQPETKKMTQGEGIDHIKQVLKQVEARRQVEIAQKRQRLAGQDQLALPFDQETPQALVALRLRLRLLFFSLYQLHHSRWSWQSVVVNCPAPQKCSQAQK